MTSPARKTRVLIVDDSAIVRKMLSDALRADPGIDVVGLASDPFVARDLILQYSPDVVTLDIEMPRMDGLTFLRKMMQHHPLPVIIVSSVTQTGSAASIEALAAGAIDVIAKPGGPHSVGQVAEKLKQRILGITPGSPLRLSPFRPAAAAPAGPTAASLSSAKGVILIGASTGGTQAIEALLTRLPSDAPPLLIVQHMPAGFTAAFATRLNSTCPMEVIEAKGGEVLKRGMAYIAPGDFHMLVEPNGLELKLAVRPGPSVHYQRPAVDVLFQSAVRLKNTPIVAALLTGMGSDGADGMVALRKAGAITIAEDEQSCVVFGMPKEAIARGGAVHVSTLLAMPRKIADSMAELQTARRSIA
jgi:two-component system, chemotaxis family, protein-glutamate methylesterase/glutaminase